MEAQIPRDTMDEKKSGGRRGRMAFGFVEEQEWKNSSSLLYARCANRKFKTYERRTSSLQTIGQRRQPLSLARQKKKKAIGGKMSPIYKSFFTIWPSISISLPLFSFFSLSLSLSLCKVQAYIISPKRSLINSEPLHPNSLSYIPRFVVVVFFFFHSFQYWIKHFYLDSRNLICFYLIRCLAFLFCSENSQC
jgi:hypothetical protein